MQSTAYTFTRIFVIITSFGYGCIPGEDGTYQIIHIDRNQAISLILKFWESIC